VTYDGLKVSKDVKYFLKVIPAMEEYANSLGLNDGKRDYLVV